MFDLVVMFSEQDVFIFSLWNNIGRCQEPAFNGLMVYELDGTGGIVL
jgi:hypothetical protein